MIVIAILEVGFGVLRVGLGLVGLTAIVAGREHALGRIVLGLEVPVLGLVALVMGWGLWTRRPWAWAGSLAVSVLGIAETVAAIPSLGSSVYSHLIGILPPLLAIVYLTRPHVRDFFRSPGRRR